MVTPDIWEVYVELVSKRHASPFGVTAEDHVDKDDWLQLKLSDADFKLYTVMPGVSYAEQRLREHMGPRWIAEQAGIPYSWFGRPRILGKRKCGKCRGEFEPEEMPWNDKARQIRATVCKQCKRTAMNARYKRLAGNGLFISRKSTKLKGNLTRKTADGG